MRYLNITFFKKHFENPLFEKIKIYLVVIADLYEREKIISYILKKINIKNFNLSKFSKENKLSKIINTFQSPSLLGGEPFVIIEDIEIFSKQDIQNLNSYLKANDVHLIIGASTRGASSLLYSSIEKKGLVFDLSLEKIWEKEKRIASFVLEKCLKANKNITSLVIEALFERVGLDLALVENEINKLITFVGLKKSIEIEDVQSICPINITESVWKIAEEIVWGKINFDNLSIDTAYFHLLISAIRFQLQLGCKMASILESGKKYDLSSYFPKIYPRALEKKKLIATERKAIFFKEAIKSLFEIDLLSKTINMNLSNLLDILKTKLLYLSAYDINATS
ncbi:MAG: hypothetical protein K1060chlam3_00946 [Candidatus Anoxychlamydiales bacterium]|nr:hypothetical protein [Candidatus Anoxychlamydiales bacterium]